MMNLLKYTFIGGVTLVIIYFCVVSIGALFEIIGPVLFVGMKYIIILGVILPPLWLFGKIIAWFYNAINNRHKKDINAKRKKKEGL